MTILNLIKNDLRRNANWFKENAVAKLVVVLGFVVVILGVVLGEYGITSVYLKFANEYAPFGPAVAVYSLKVAVFLLFIFAVISSTAISSSILYQNTTLRHLFTQPVKPISIFMSKVIPGWITSTLVLLLLIPLFAVYNKFIFEAENLWITVGVGLLILSVVSQAIGTILSTMVAYFFGRITKQKWLIVFIAMLIGFFLLVRVLFPTDMFELAEADSFTTFQEQLDKLPLTGNLLPTNWIVDGLSGELSLFSVFWAGLAVFCLLSIVRSIGQDYYVTAWRRAQNQTYLADKDGTKLKPVSNFPKLKGVKNIYAPLIINDLLSFIRSSAEINYSLFLTGLLAILIFSINNLTKLKDTTPGLLMAVDLIAFVSVSLIFLILATRLIYPMVAKEKLTSWFSFGLPISRETFLKEKLLVSIMLSMPAIIVSIITVWGLKLTLEKGFTLTLLMFLTILVINILQCLLGSINPNFVEAENPEAVSTSSMGILALIISLGFIVFSTIQLSGYLHGTINGFIMMIRWIVAAIVLVTPILLIANKSVKKYSL